jgi:predicted amidohydrolase YtcJ
MKTPARLRIIVALLVIVVLASVVFVVTRPIRADAVFINGRVHTLDEANRSVEALAVAGGRILSIGSTEEVTSRYEADTLIDLSGHTVIPSFVDGHGRLLNLGVLSLTLDVSGAGSAQAAGRMVHDRARLLPRGTWIRGRGWQNPWWYDEQELPKAILDRASTEHPVFLIGEDGESAWVNSIVLDSARTDGRISETADGAVLRDRNGEPVGILFGEAAELISNAMPPPTDWELNAALDSAIGACLRGGITTLHDFGISSMDIDLYKKRIAEGRFPMRVYGIIGVPGETWDSFKRGGALVGFGDDRLEALERGFQMCVHATGDRGVRIALNAYVEALGDRRPEPGELRLEGVQLIGNADLLRAKDLGVILSLQPVQYLMDFDVASLRLGPQRMVDFLPWDVAIDSGIVVSGGTDLPLAPPEPLLGISLVVGREGGESEEDGPPIAAGGNRRLAALRMFTTWSAVAGLEGDLKGSLEEGKLADFLVLSGDPLAVPLDEISHIRVLTTVLGGRVVYDRALRP